MCMLQSLVPRRSKLLSTKQLLFRTDDHVGQNAPRPIWKKTEAQWEGRRDRGGETTFLFLGEKGRFQQRDIMNFYDPTVIYTSVYVL